MELSYRGTRYHGWQIQTNGTSVQELVEKALSTVLRQPVGIVGSGRTDTGVHAEQQYAHFETAAPLPSAASLVHSLNCILPEDIAVYRIFPVRSDDHARFTAISRYYQYRIIRRKDPFRTKQAYVYPPDLAVDRMNEAAARLLEYDDFESFSRLKTEVKHFRCRIKFAYWRQEGDTLTFHIKADRFLRGMVRALVGTLLEVGLGRMTTETFEQIIRSKDRKRAGRAAPPEGLFLVAVAYPEDVFKDL